MAEESIHEDCFCIWRLSKAPFDLRQQGDVSLCRRWGCRTSSSKVNSTVLPLQTWIANLVLPLEASCESAVLDASRSYRFVLSSTSNSGQARSDLKSVYLSGKPVVRGGRVLWKEPFGDKL